MYWTADDPNLLFTLSAVVLALAALGHVLLKKRDSRGAVAWVGFILFVPVAGGLIYYLFGINRVARRAAKLKGLRVRDDPALAGTGVGPKAARAALSPRLHHLAGIARRVDYLSSNAPVGGNKVEPFDGGDRAYAEMLTAIDGATRSVALSSYIFRNDAIGGRFADALERAHDRGVTVRVLVDGVGAYDSWQPVLYHLRRAGVPVQRFLFSLVPWRMPYLNMRNHAKLLIADGRLAFTGGLNIKEECLLETVGPAEGVDDVHFRLEGPIVTQVMERFAADWCFTTGETLMGEEWYPDLAPAGDLLGRGIASGPDYEENPLRWTLLAAILSARRSIRIVTPYFLPDETVLSALKLAAAGGVGIEIVLPETSDHRILQWAGRVEQETALAAGAKIWLRPAPFDHTKLMTVDGAWSLIGSGNWDMRSLRLNFEYVAEWYDTNFAARIDALIDRRVAVARPLSLGELRTRPILTKLRDGAAHLVQPYM
ncbi:PLDc N-terminal domain-containing protein [Marivibrio halodurans]|uniref:Phospholipase D n=2 Tax=Marivibrio halodurans TaxID=2039722 RepID=A0A8J7S320_9PROT|nr:PLDc N-terminal domain-containing protein [Marivibrio halodurans]